jgi:hypothetical protein
MDGGGGARLETGGAIETLGTAGTFRHSITWRRLTVTVIRARLRTAPSKRDHLWVTPSEALRLPASSLLAKSLRVAGVLPQPPRRRRSGPRSAAHAEV